MNYKSLLYMSLLACNSFSPSFAVTPTYTHRFQGCDLFCHLIGGWNTLYDTNDNARAFSAGLWYMQSFSNHTIAQDLFRPDNSDASFLINLLPGETIPLTVKTSGIASVSVIRALSRQESF